MGNWHLLVFTWLLLTLTNCSENLQAFEEKGCEPRFDFGSRLPKDVVPSKYVITISPDFLRDEFHGAVQINFNVLQPRNYVALHANNLTIRSTKLYHYESLNNCEKVPIRSVYPVERYEMLIIELFKPIMGEYSLRVNFSASLIGKIDGFYLSTYHDDSRDGSTVRKLAVTQFEPIYARKAFPCFDEPIFKSEYHIRLVCSASSGYHALSNMPPVKIERSTNNSDLVTTTFAPSLPMSTYLVAFVVSDFVFSMSSINSLNGTRIPISIYTRPSNKGKVQFALNVATRATKFYMNVFGIDYSLPKIDLIAVPDFEAGAMENWGLITFRETDVIYSANHSSCRNIKSVSLTIAHELAHMWFGNLVTLKWWEDLWLNEGFATYMEHVAVDFIFPDWNQLENFALETKYVTMPFDSKTSTHSIIRETKNSDEIEQMFDHISYQKGAAIIRMLEDAMGKHKFIFCIGRYLKKYKYSNAATDQLFHILQRHVQDGISILEFMNSWTKYPGFPVINVQRHGKVIRLSQKRFITNKRFDINSKQTWNIPIKYITNEIKDGIQFGWFLANTSCVELAVKESVKWIKLNHNSVGYYVVNYTEDGWNTFSSLLVGNLRVLSPLNRADLLHNAFLLADATDLSYCVALNLTTFLLDENALQPWAVTANWLVQTDRLISGTDLYPQFQRYAQTLVNTIYKKVGWTVKENDTFIRRELRTVILKLACSVGHENCLNVAKNKLKNLIDSNGTQKPHPDIRSVVYSYGLVPLGVETESMFHQMWKLFLCETDVQEKERLMIGLANVRDTNILKRYLKMVRNEEFVRRQNYFEAAVKVALNPKGLNLVWNFVKNNWESLVEKYTLSDSAMGKAVGTIISLFKNEEYLEEAKAFCRKYPEAGAGANARRDALEEVTNNINWLDNNVEIIRRWLKANGFYSNE